MGFWDDVKGFGGKVWNSTIGSDPGADQERKRKALLYQQAAASGGFADASQAGYNALGQQGQGALAGLQRLASGQDSISAEQLRQGNQQLIAAQRSLAAGAAPQNAAMAARTAAIQAGRIGSGLAGQQALAGLQERQQAQQQYAALLQGLRGQDLQATQGARGQAIQGYGAGNAGAPEKSWIDKWGPVIQGGASIATAASDRRLKTDIKDGDAAATKAIAEVRPYTFVFRDPRFGAGQQLSTMTDDLKRAGLGHAVIPTPAGEMVDGAKLALANTAMIAAIGRQLEKQRPGPYARQYATQQRAGRVYPVPMPVQRTPWDYTPQRGTGGGELSDMGGQ